MAKPIELTLFSESRLDPRPHNGLITYNPNIELFAGAAGSKSLQIWRSNGQVVTKSSQRGEKDSVEALHWKADGQFLAVGWSDGVVRLMGLESSKAAYQIPICEAGKSRITCIGWARNNSRKHSDSNSPSSTTPREDLVSHDLFPGGKKTAMDLPRELTFLEVETALPKLSPLPASGGSGDDSFIFTTRSSLEFLFRPFSPHDSDRINVMIVGTNDGRIHVSIYDSFVIGIFQYDLPRPSGKNISLQLCHHVSHPDLSTHMLMFKPSGEANTAATYLVPIDLTFIHSSPENLSLLASKTTTLQKLLRYVNQVQLHMMHEWQSTRELPTRFLNSINGTLREAGSYGEMTIGQAIYHSVVTGHTFPEVREWLVDQLAERGHKRWDKAVVSGLQALRSLVHENFLPALERIGIILSRLLGIARFHESKAETGFTSPQITRVMDIVSCLMLVGNKILLAVMEELELFQSFSIWLRHEIDRLASSSSTDELSEKEATMEHGKVLAYVQQYMPASPLRHHLSSVPVDISEKGRQLAESGSSLLELLGKQLKKQDDGQLDDSPFTQVEFLCGYLDSKAGAIFTGIAEAEKRSVRFGQPTAIELETNILKFDVTMSAISNSDTSSQALTYTALITENNESSVYVFRTTMNVLNGISGSVTAEVSYMVLGDGKVFDLKFLYDDSLLVLWAPKDQPLRLVRIPHKSQELGYRPYIPGGKITPHILSHDEVISVFQNMIVPCEPSFIPAYMEVKRGSSEHGTIPPRVCLLGSNSQTYKVFALPENRFKDTTKN